MYPGSFSALNVNSTDGLEKTASTDNAAHTKGSWSTVVSSTPHAIPYFTVNLGWRNYYHNHLVDIAIGSAGNEEVIVPNIFFGCNNGGYGEHRAEVVHCPIPIKAGERISARYQKGTTGANACIIHIPLPALGGFEDHSKYMGIGKCVDIGANTASTTGVYVDPGATANTWGSWYQMTASTSVALKAITMRFGPNSITYLQDTSFWIEIGIGSAGNEETIAQRLCLSGSTPGILAVLGNNIPLPVHIPSGTRIAARAKCGTTDATDRLLRITLLGWY